MSSPQINLMFANRRLPAIALAAGLLLSALTGIGCVSRLSPPSPVGAGEPGEEPPAPLVSASFDLDPEPLEATAPLPEQEDIQALGETPAAATLAVFSVDNPNSASQTLLNRAGERIVGLRPEAILALSASGRPIPTELREQLTAMTENLSPPLPHLILHEFKEALHLEVWEAGEAWLFIDFAQLATAPETELGTTIKTLQEHRRDYPDGSLIVFANRQPPESQTAASFDFWHRLQSFLPENRTAVVSADAERFSWWRRQDGIEVYSLPAIDQSRQARPDLATGRFNGFLWGGYDADNRPVFRAVTLAGILDRNEFFRDDQIVPEVLKARLTATPIDDFAPVTTVTLHNPTEHTLEFSARWQAANGEVRADPHVVGFTLQPDQTFTQIFRLHSNANTPWKFQRPRFLLHTQIPGPGDFPRSIELQAEPWCRIGATAHFRETPLVIDGNLADWEHPGLQINHETQVVSGRPAWRGPADFSGVVHFAHDRDNLYVAVRVVDDFLGNPDNLPGYEKACVYVALEPPARPSSDKESVALLALCAEPNGDLHISRPGASPEAETIRGVVAATESGYAVEFAIPRQVFPEHSIPNPLYMDVAIHDFDPGTEIERNRKTMQLSGRGRQPELFAVVRLEKPPTANAEESE